MLGKGGSSDKGDPTRAYLKEALAAIKDGDDEGAIEALHSAMKACGKGGEPDTDDEG